MSGRLCFSHCKRFGRRLLTLLMLKVAIFMRAQEIWEGTSFACRYHGGALRYSPPNVSWPVLETELSPLFLNFRQRLECILRLGFVNGLRTFPVFGLFLTPTLSGVSLILGGS